MVRAGEMQLSLGSLDKALHFADQSLDIDPHEPRAWALRAHVEQNAGQFEQALADFHRALEFNHDDRQLLFETAELYRQLNRPQRALSTLTCLCETYAAGRGAATGVVSARPVAERLGKKRRRRRRVRLGAGPRPDHAGVARAPGRLRN